MATNRTPTTLPANSTASSQVPTADPSTGLAATGFANWRSGSFDGWMGEVAFLGWPGWWMVEVVESLACCVVCLSLPGPHVPPFVFVYDALGPANSVTQKINPMFYPEGV